MLPLKTRSEYIFIKTKVNKTLFIPPMNVDNSFEKHKVRKKLIYLVYSLKDI